MICNLAPISARLAALRGCGGSTRCGRRVGEVWPRSEYRVPDDRPDVGVPQGPLVWNDVQVDVPLEPRPVNS